MTQVGVVVWGAQSRDENKGGEGRGLGYLAACRLPVSLPNPHRTPQPCLLQMLGTGLRWFGRCGWLLPAAELPTA
jgi:hypothetical protein